LGYGIQNRHFQNRHIFVFIKKGYVKIWIQKKLQKKHTQGGRRADCRFCGVGVEISKGHVKIETQNKFTKQNTQRLEGGEIVNFMELVLKYRRDVSKYKYKKNYNQNHTEGGRRGDCRFCGVGVEISKGHEERAHQYWRTVCIYCVLPGLPHW